VPAAQYKADPSDPIDLMLAAGLAALDRDSARKLMLRKLSLGRYEIDGRRVTVRWGSVGGAHGLVASEDNVKARQGRHSEVALVDYLTQAAHVATALLGGRDDMPKIARVPKEQRLTFGDDGSRPSTKALHMEEFGNERCESMRIACEQALLRERAAEAYERSQRRPLVRS